MYKSIVFDLGGVMVDFAPRAFAMKRSKSRCTT